MPELTAGTLLVVETRNGPKVMLERPTRKGTARAPVPAGQLCAELAEWNGPDGLQVEFELVNGQPTKVRKAGSTWTAPPTAEPRNRPASGRQAQGRPQGRRGGRARAPRDSVPAPGFHNPYNFVPLTPREGMAGELGDGPPKSHDRYHSDAYTGNVVVKMTTVTPLLLPDTRPGEVQEDDSRHKTYNVLQLGGQPYLPSSSVRGMLRSAYEAATNSRLGVFAGHDRRLGMRLRASSGLALVPARVIGGHVELYPGDQPLPGSPRTPGLPARMMAAWLPMYTRGSPGVPASRVTLSGRPLVHGQQVWCWLQEVKRWRWNRRRGQYSSFRYWRVIEAAVGSAGLSASPTITTDAPPTPPPRGQGRRPYHQKLPTTLQVEGVVCITHQNIGTKHDERVFFSAGGRPAIATISDEVRDHWRELILDYRSVHKDRVAKVRDRGGDPSQLVAGRDARPAWSRHVLEAGVEDLPDGTLCHAVVETTPSGLRAKALYPVMISRELQARPPSALLPSSHAPASALNALSPAERVFGWVQDPGEGACRSQVSIGPVTCLDEDAVESFDPPLPLAILSSPKPQQGRFYVARDATGTAQADGLSKEAASYTGSDKGLRGRKVYPHHRGLPADYWQNPLEDRTQIASEGRYQEYRRSRAAVKEKVQGRSQPVQNDDGTWQLTTEEQRDDQNRSVTGWVRQQKRFQFEVRFQNLSRVELGALLWLCSQDRDGAERYHRLGGGKPLGFGSVRLDVEAFHAWRGKSIAQRYGSIAGVLPETEPDLLANCIKDYREAVETAYGAPFENVPFVAALKRAMEGFADGLPVHYPRARQGSQRGNAVPPHPDGLSYEWFVANEKEPDGPRLTLKGLADDPGLPYLAKG